MRSSRQREDERIRWLHLKIAAFIRTKADRADRAV
jgi:hypothetical protein